MSKHLLIAFLCFYISLNSFAQDDTFLNLQGGIGYNYGLVGVKTVIGKNNNGLVIGTGSLGGQFCYQIGGQISKNWFYASAAYGVTQVYVESFSGKTTLAQGVIFLLGAMVDLTSNDRLFLDIGVGYQQSSPVNLGFGATSDPSGPAFAVGLGYRISK